MRLMAKTANRLSENVRHWYSRHSYYDCFHKSQQGHHCRHFADKKSRQKWPKTLKQCPFADELPDISVEWPKENIAGSLKIIRFSELPGFRAEQKGQPQNLITTKGLRKSWAILTNAATAKIEPGVSYNQHITPWIWGLRHWAEKFGPFNR